MLAPSLPRLLAALTEATLAGRLACPALIEAKLDGQSPTLRYRGAAGSPGMARLARIV